MEDAAKKLAGDIDLFRETDGKIVLGDLLGDYHL